MRRKRAPRPLIDIAMTASAVTALLLMAIWFFFLADSPLAPLPWAGFVPRDWISSFGEIATFCARVMGDVFNGRVFRFFGETLRQAGILILGSAIVIWGWPSSSGSVRDRGRLLQPQRRRAVELGRVRGLVRPARDHALRVRLHDVGQGRHRAGGRDRRDADLGRDRRARGDGRELARVPLRHRLLGAWIVLPAIYVGAVGAGFLASYVAVVQQIGEVSSGGYFLIFWMFQNPPDLLYCLIKAMAMATVIVLIGCYYGYNAGGGPVGVGTATAKSMVLNTVMVHIVGMVGTQIFWGSNPRAPIGG